MYKLELSRQAGKDAKIIERTGLRPKVMGLLRMLRDNPFQNPPSYEKLVNRDDTYSRRISLQHRLVYQVEPNTELEKDQNGEPYQGIVHVVRMWTHYE